MAERRRSFAPVALSGLGAAALAAVASTRDWLAVDGSASGGALSSGLTPTAAQESPLAAALALVVLACWGVVLVTRRRFRRAVAALGAVAGVGFAATVVSAPWLMRRAYADELRRVVGAEVGDIGLTAWWWAALAAAVLVVVTTVLAVLLVPHWPEMGSRYDAPADAADARRGTPESGIDLWKALDEGRDPTA